jgi:hypothetical protein
MGWKILIFEQPIYAVLGTNVPSTVSLAMPTKLSSAGCVIGRAGLLVGLWVLQQLQARVLDWL